MQGVVGSSAAGGLTTLGGEAAIAAFRTTRQVYRDLMRMTRHAGQFNGNEATLQATIRTQFKAHLLETDPTKIAHLKSQAIKALSNYYVHQAKLMVGDQQPRSIYEDDHEDDQPQATMASLLQSHRRPEPQVADAEVHAPSRKRLTAAERRKNVIRTRQHLHEKQKRFVDDFTSFTARYKEALQQQQQPPKREAMADEPKESGGTV